MVKCTPERGHNALFFIPLEVFIDTVPKTCVSSKVLIFVVTLRIKQRTMKLTSEQRSEIISEILLSGKSFSLHIK